MVRARLATAFAALLSLVVMVLAAPATAATDWYEPTNPQEPDSQINAEGEPFTGTTADGEVRGLIDAHTHMFMDIGMGGNAVCGSTWSEAGIADALKDCPNHGISLLENLTNEGAGRGPLDPHDTVGWPTFNDWPTYSSFTHQQMYYKWVERAWRGGQRIMVNDMVSNPGLCPIIPVVSLTPNRFDCNDMDTVRRQIDATYELQAFIDEQYGGEGKGWYRVVTTPEQARDVIADGKLAVVLGVEVSEPFDCKQSALLGSGCDEADIDAGLDELKAKGVTSMFLCHKFDNALCGVKYDEGTAGILVNAGQFVTTGAFWDPRQCEPGEVPDNTIISGLLPVDLIGALSTLGVPAVLPIYPEGPHCNPRGLTELGEYALRGMIERDMIVEIDHMSAKAAERSLEIMEEEGHAGVVTSHSWLHDAFMERVYALGGFGTQYGHTAQEYVDGWNTARPILDKYDAGYGFGSDMNGFGGTPAPPADDATITYPFTSLDGGTVFDRQVTGERTWDYNTEGVSHYGMLPDWIESVTTLAGPGLSEDLMAGSESYLCMWESTLDQECGQTTTTPTSPTDPTTPGSDGTDDTSAGAPAADPANIASGGQSAVTSAAGPGSDALPQAGMSGSAWWIVAALLALQLGVGLCALRPDFTYSRS